MDAKQWIMLCLFYILSPIDFVPEAVLGPLGLPDDIAAFLIAAYYFYQEYVKPLIQNHIR